MGLDKLDSVGRAAVGLGIDLLLARDQYRSHDPKLADALASKAYEIFQDFGIDDTDIESMQVSTRGGLYTESSVSNTSGVSPDDEDEDLVEALRDVVREQRERVGD